MSITVDIPGGQATLRSQDELKQRQRRDIEAAALAASSALVKVEAAGIDQENPSPAALAQAGLTRSEWGAMLELQDASILAFLKSWTRPEPLPSWDTLGDLDTAVYDALKTATAEAGGAAAAAALNVEPSPDETGPTAPSGASGTALRDDQESESATVTMPSPSDTASTDIAPYTVG